MTTKQLRIGLLNAGSLGTNHDNFIATCTRLDMDVLAINETWLKGGDEDRAPILPGSRLRHNPRPQGSRSRGGGVGFFIKRNISARNLSHPVDPRHKSIEQMWIHLTLQGKKLVIGTAYRPPWQDTDLFLDALSDTISSLSNYDNLILLGDFNINLMTNSDPKITKLNNFLSSFNLAQLVTEPTHFTNTSQTLIDVVCTDMNAKKINIEHVGSLFGHCLVVCEFNIKRNKPKPFTITHRPLNNIIRSNFDTDLRSVRWDLMSALPNVNEKVEELSRHIVCLFDLHAPIKTFIIRGRSYPWITDTVKLMMHMRDQAAAVYHKTGSESKKIYYKDLKSTVNKALFHEKSAYFNQNINNNIKNSKKLWKNLKTTILPKKNEELPAIFNDPDIINYHFLNLPAASKVTISQLTYYEYHSFNESVFHIKTVSSDNLLKIVSSLKSNAEGNDLINLNMLLMTFPYTVDLLTDVINTSILTSTFPEPWKIAVVRPLPKNPNPAELKELRPISILPCISKILERAVCAQLTDYIEKNAILPDVQSGFRKGRSTVTALLDVTDNILWAQDKGMCTLLVLLDFSRAFDCINIDLLLSKLSYYGFDSGAVSWFHSYLCKRHQYVKLSLKDGKNKFSAMKDLARGVPQGSILGPILFILYTADIGNHITHCRYHVYADDVQIYISCKPSDIDSAVQKLNTDLQNIASWAQSNSLMLNPTKTQYIIFGTICQINSIRPTIAVKLLGEPIQRVHEARNLGLIMDSGLRFEKHVTGSVRNCFYRLKVLYKIRPFINETLRIQLVESLILSKLNYMDTVYGPRLLAKTKRLIQRVQNACARFCFDIPPRAHVTPFLNKHNILKMAHRRKLHLACLLFGVIKYETPAYLFEKLSWFSSRRSHRTRQCSIQLMTPQHASAAFRGSFRYVATRCWNIIPPPFRNLEVISSFRAAIRKCICEHQRRQETLALDTSCF
jgi:hypothetical protein